ncbi:hypothetical protein D1871_14655 [Nakamurella silvestris]|nr:hypothetical protein D1871_14655 [Nakamurella silvestris]
MTSFTPAVRSWTNASGQHRTSVHARNSDALKLVDTQGRPLVRLEVYKDELWLVDDDDLLVNSDAPGLSTSGIYGFDARGTKNHESALTDGDFGPGALIDLVRAPAGANDPTAIGISAAGREEIAGYADKKTALFLAPKLDDGVELTAISLRGAPVGEHTALVTVLVAEPELMAHLRRNL